MKFVTAIFFFLFFSQAKAQEEKLTKNVLTATILSPGISYEMAAGNKVAVKLKGVIFSAFSYSSGALLNGRNHFLFSPTPLFTAEGRYYYNFQRRLEKSKNISRNSANYIGVSGKYGYAIETYYSESGGTVTTFTKVYDAGIVWGMQRNYKNRFSLDFNMGPSILDPLLNQEFGFTMSLALGIWLGKRTD